MKTTRRSTATAATLLAAAMIFSSACGSDAEDGDSNNSATEPVEISAAWARTSPEGATAGAAYLDITTEDDDRVISATVDSSVAGSVELHETVQADASMEADSDMNTDMDHDMESDEMDMNDMDHDMGEMDGAMTMQEVTDGVELPAGETVSFEPGGYHFMMLDLPSPLEAGDTFELSLTLENAGTQTVSVEVRDDAP